MRKFIESWSTHQAKRSETETQYVNSKKKTTRIGVLNSSKEVTRYQDSKDKKALRQPKRLLAKAECKAKGLVLGQN